jgi:ribosomal protein S4
VSREEYAGSSFKGIVSSYFNNSYLSAVSALVKEEKITVEELKELIEKMQATKSTPKWLECDSENLTAKVVAIPEKSDIDFEFQEQLIVELYSK